MLIDTTNKEIFIDYVTDDYSKDLEECAEYLKDKIGWKVTISSSLKGLFKDLLFGVRFTGK